eukprot:EG_transcript_42142
MTSCDGLPPQHGILQSMFLHAPPELLEEVLGDCNGALEQAVDRLLAMSSDAAASSAPRATLLPSLAVAPVEPAPCACLHTFCTAALDEALLYGDGAGQRLPADSVLRDYVCAPSPNSPPPAGAASSSSSSSAPTAGGPPGPGRLPTAGPCA